MKIIIVAGARPNFMKIAPLVWEFNRREFNSYIIVHTGQHYDWELSKQILEELRIGDPDIHLENFTKNNSKSSISNIIESASNYLMKSNTKFISKVLNKYKKKIHTIFHFGEFARIFQSFKKFDQCFESNSIGSKKYLIFV